MYINQFSQISQSDPVCDSFTLVGVYWLVAFISWVFLESLYKTYIYFLARTRTHITYTHISIERKIQFAQLCHQHSLDMVMPLIGISFSSCEPYQTAMVVIWHGTHWSNEAFTAKVFFCHPNMSTIQNNKTITYSENIGKLAKKINGQTIFFQRIVWSCWHICISTNPNSDLNLNDFVLWLN